MKILKKALIYDISNMAYVIADTGEPVNHNLHKVRDICQEGNIDRVSRVLGLAYSNVLAALLPVLRMPRLDTGKDCSAKPHDYEICLRDDRGWRHVITPERKLKIKETVHEYMVCMVLYDWLGVTLPPAADVWKYRGDEAFGSLQELVEEICGEMAENSMNGGFRRKLSPF